MLGIVLGIKYYRYKKRTQSITQAHVIILVAGTGFEPVTFGL